VKLQRIAPLGFVVSTGLREWCLDSCFRVASRKYATTKARGHEVSMNSLLASKLQSKSG